MVRKQEIQKRGEVVIYKGKGGKVSLDVKLDRETVWLTQKQMSELFQTERSVVTKHIRNIFMNRELEKKSVCAIFAHTALDGKVYDTQYYNLDMIISLGYRVNSKQGTAFRIWATKVLKDHLIQGYTVYEQRLKAQKDKFESLKKTVQLLEDISLRKSLTGDEASALLRVIRDYTYALDVLDDYDHESLQVADTTEKDLYQITYQDAMGVIARLKETFGGSSLFGHEKDQSFRSSLAAIYQSFSGKDLYPSVEEKAANFIYFVVKNHSFSDGNKRIAAALFIWFLQKNRILYRGDGTKRIADNALVALTLLIAESHPKEKETIVKLVVNLINKKN